MALWQIVLFGIVALVVIAIALEAYLKRNRTPRTMTQRYMDDLGLEEHADPDKPELGMEAIDMDVIRLSERGNKSAAAPGARETGFWTRQTRQRNRKTNRPDTGKETKK
jgi:hypothetical protein